MKFLKSNTTRIALACFIIFMAIPFIFVESNTPIKNTTPGIPMEQSSNPLAKIIDRIGSFYGFKKSPAKQQVRSSFEKKNNLVASTKMRGKSQLASSEMAQAKEPPLEFGDITADSNFSTPSRKFNKEPSLPLVKEYIRMDGGTYEVIKGHDGRKFVAMPDGFVPYEKLMADTVSQEDFEAAKKQAPQLEDWEIFEALRSPGGLPAYLAAGGNNVLYKDPNRGYYDKEGKEGTRLFGMRSSGRGGSTDDIYDERKLSASIAENGAKISGGSAALSSIRSKVDATKASEKEAENKQTTDPNALESLIANGIIIGNKTEILKKTVPTNTFQEKKTKDSSSERIEVFQAKDNNNDVNNHMLNAFTAFGIKPFEKETVTGEILSNQWKYPDVASLNNKKFLGVEFAKINDFPEPLSESFKQSDILYDDISTQINKMQKVNNFKLNIAVVDGADNNGIKAVRDDSFHYKIVEGLTGAKNIADERGYISIKPEDKAKTLIVVSDNQTWQNLKKAGYNTVMFNKYAITPADLNSLYNETLDTVQKMSVNIASAEKLSEKERLAKVQDINSVRVGFRGI